MVCKGKFPPIAAPQLGNLATLIAFMHRQFARAAMNKAFGRFSTWVAEIVGKPVTFVAALTLIALWALTGPFFGYSEAWQLIVNTGTTIITFLMIFVLQNTQNRDGQALQAKLDELILTSAAENKYIGVEKLTERELRDLRGRIDALAKTPDVTDPPDDPPKVVPFSEKSDKLPR
jgi:low affinity Fe/Cu permease